MKKRVKRQYDNERRGWDVYYDTLDGVEQALNNKDPLAMGLQQKAKAMYGKARWERGRRPIVF